jgi:alkaline phosphatase D
MSPYDLHHFVQSLQHTTQGMPPQLRRRRFMQGALALAAASILAPPSLRPAYGQARFTAYPFSLGIASGSPRADGIVLWTRLAPEPLGDGGMGAERVTVKWEIADDEQFKRIVQTGDVSAVPELAHSVHAEVAGLQPERWYWYRFIAGDEVSPAGRTKTASAGNATKLRFAFASCQQYEQGFFSAYRHMVKEDLDLVAFLGDYIYESSWGRQHVRKHAGPEPETLAQYRTRYAQYKTDADLKAMHAAVPWLVTWDDHEVDNDYADDESEHLDPQFLLRRAAAYQAYYEHMPLARSALPRGPNMRLYDRFAFGNLAEFFVLDDRQYRSHLVCPKPGRAGSNVVENCAERLDPKRSLLGTAQEKWLFDGLAASRATWNVLTQQTLMAQLDQKPGAGQSFWTDGWDGYPESRARLLNFLTERKIANPLVIGGDVHCNYVCDIKRDFSDPKSRTIATEFCGTSITSQALAQDRIESWRPDNPHILLADGRKRGYVVVELGKDKAATNLRIIDNEKARETNVSTLASYVVEVGKPGAQKA